MLDSLIQRTFCQFLSGNKILAKLEKEAVVSQVFISIQIIRKSITLLGIKLLVKAFLVSKTLKSAKSLDKTA